VAVDTLLDIGLRNALGATALAALVAGFGRVCRRPALLHSLWLLVLLKLLIPPLLPLPLLPRPLLPEAVAAPAAPTHATDGAPGPAPDLEEPAAETELAPALGSPEPAADVPSEPAPPEPRVVAWRPVVLSLWLTGSVLWWTLAGQRLARFRRLLRHARPAPPTVQEQAARLAARLGLARCPGVWLVPAAVSPMLWALGGWPRLLLPARLWDRLSPEQQDTLLAHELAHLRRGDHWVRRLELLVLGLYWWHPVAWWARRELREAEEQCCDAWVVWALPAAARAYATALLETVTFLSQCRPALPAAANGAGHVQRLRRRLTMILHGTTSRTLTWGGLLLVAALAAVLLPLWPTWAEPPRPADPPPPPNAGASTAPAVAPPAGPAAGEDPFTPPARGEKRRPVREEEEDGPKTTRPPARAGDRGSQVQDLQDEIELLEARLDVKRAELVAAEKALQGAVARLDRIKKLSATGAISMEELTRAQGEVDTLEAQLLVNKAEMKEPEVRLKQARRRLEQLQGRGADTPAVPRPESWAEELFDDLFKDFGTVPHGQEVSHTFRLTNRTKDHVHIAGVRVSNASVTATPYHTDLDPGQQGGVMVRMVTGRFTGPKTVRIYVQFDRPRADEVVLLVRANSRDGGDEAKQPGAQKRLQELEKKLDDLLKEMDALRKELGPQKPGGRGAADKDVRYYVSRSRAFKLPIQVDPAQGPRLRGLRLYSSTDEGKSWQHVASVPPGATMFDFNAPADGVYWLTVCTVDLEGKQTPEPTANMKPEVKVRVDTTDPE
jgi:beta-lactamase regulating signal transducer with metallopeptidase domain